MIKLPTKFGDLYVDLWFGKDNKLRIYDSEKRYLNYIEKETILEAAEIAASTPAHTLLDFYHRLKCCNSLDSFLRKVVENTYRVASKDWEIIASYLRHFCIDKYDSPESLLTNEWVNKIGDYYIVVEEA